LLKLGCCDGFHAEERVVAQAVEAGIVEVKFKVVADEVAIRNSRHSSLCFTATTAV